MADVRSSTSKMILILEDNPELVELLKDLMSNRNDEIISVTDAESALPLLQQRKFDLLICDLHLPGMSGVAFLKRCEKEKILPQNIMIISGDIQNPDLSPDFLSRCILLEKPFFIDSFPTILENIFSDSLA